jgi:hypothetical protein
MMKEYWITAIINVICNLFVVILVEILRKPRSTTQRLTVVSAMLALIALPVVYIGYALQPRPDEAKRIFSDFEMGRPFNAYGIPWAVFNDNAYNGRSNVTTEIQDRHEPGDKHFAALSYYLGPQSSGDPYCGVYSGFAYRPDEPRDVSGYEGIELDLWHDGEIPEGVRIFIQISPYRLIASPDGHYQFELTDYARHQKPTKTYAPFKMFTQPPGFVGPAHEFDREFQQSVYKVGILIQGRKGSTASGRLFIDNLRFF